jgi:COMPASS component BRE2
MLGYYPSVSVFRGGAVEVKFGPNFWHPPLGYESDNHHPNGEAAADEDDVDVIRSATSETGPDGEISRTPNSRRAWPPSLSKVRPMEQRYVEQIAEDVVWDIVDEITYWVQDGCRIVDFTAKDEAEKQVGGAAGAVAQEEIKELVQDD